MSTALMTPLASSGFVSTPWKNGGGVTVDIAGEYRPGTPPGDWRGMIWRFGRTGIVAPGPFSDLTGYERLQAVVAGRGLVLETPDGEIDLREPFRPVRYDGGTPVASRLEAGPVEVVNLIADRALRAIALLAPAPGESLALEPGTHLLYAAIDAVSGRLGETGFAVPAGDALRIETGGPERLVLASGQALLATIRPRG